jgi:hypothetical protein
MGGRRRGHHQGGKASEVNEKGPPGALLMGRSHLRVLGIMVRVASWCGRSRSGAGRLPRAR